MFGLYITVTFNIFNFFVFQASPLLLLAIIATVSDAQLHDDLDVDKLKEDHELKSKIIIY